MLLGGFALLAIDSQSYGVKRSGDVHAGATVTA